MSNNYSPGGATGPHAGLQLERVHCTSRKRSVSLVESVCLQIPVIVIFVSPPNVVWLEAYCFRPVHPRVHVSVCASQNIVNTISCRVFDTFSPNLHQ